MKLSPVIASVLLLALPLSACGDDEDPTTTPTSASPSATATTIATPEAPQTASDLVIAPGQIGPAEAGMSKSEALETGLFNADVKIKGEVCDGVQPLEWKKAFAGVDVLTSEAGDIVSLGAFEADGPRTEDDLGVGSRYGDLVDAYGSDLTKPEDAGYGQAGVFVKDGDRWIGFLFGDATAADDVETDSEVTFIEVTAGEKPGLMRDGC